MKLVAVYGIRKDSSLVKATLTASGITYWCSPSSKTYFDEKQKKKVRYAEEIGIEDPHQLTLEVKYYINKVVGVDESGQTKLERIYFTKTVADYLNSFGRKLNYGKKNSEGNS